MTSPVHWRDDANCLDEDPELFFPTSYVDHKGVQQAMQAIGVCLACPVRQRCLDAELAVEGTASKHYRNGIRGGLTPGQRARLASGATTEKTAKCGTAAGYQQHRRDDTAACQPCKDAENKRAKAAAAEKPGRPVPRCGTISGYNRHVRLQERTCEQCRAAQRFYQWKKRQQKAEKAAAEQALAA